MSEESLLASNGEKMIEIANSHVLFQKFVEGGFVAERWADVPVTSKERLLEILDGADEDLYRSAYVSPSGATGGRSVSFPVSIKENREMRERFASHLLNAGVLSANDVYLNLFFHDNCYRSMEIFDEFARLVGATCINLGPSVSNEDILHAIRRFHCTSIFASSRRLTDFAVYLQKKGEIIPLKNILFAAEPLQGSKMNLLQKVFHTKDITGVYGSSESGVWAYQALEDSGTDIYTCHEDMVHVEIDSPGENGIGNILVTSLIRVSKMPTIRFRMGDRGKIITQGNDTVRFQLAGREGKYFLFADGLIPVHSVMKLIPSEVLEWQILLDMDAETVVDILTLRISAPSSVSLCDIQESLTHFIQENSTVSNDNVSIRVERCEMDEFYLSSIGKILSVKDLRK